MVLVAVIHTVHCHHMPRREGKGGEPGRWIFLVPGVIGHGKVGRKVCVESRA